jgi:DNA-binding transcriptional LysR family regulator
MAMDNWDEIKTAFHVARLGTVSAAADVLGVHHATVIRHIDALETRLKVKLFQRHARGYTPTEAGQDLMRVAQATEDQFNQLSSRLIGQGEGVSGEIVITSLAMLAPMLSGPLRAFREQYPDVCIRFLTDERLYRLEYGEAHVAIRAGSPSQDLDNIVQPLTTLTVGMFAHPDYLNVRGTPKSIDDLSGHHFVVTDDLDARAPFYKWLLEVVSREQLVFRGSDPLSQMAAIHSGIGIGFIDRDWGRTLGLVEVLEPQPEWSAQIWVVTHVDLHRTNKVQALVQHLKAWEKEKE